MLNLLLTSAGSKNFNIKLRSVISSNPGLRVNPVDDVGLYFASSLYVISLYVNSNLKTKS